MRNLNTSRIIEDPQYYFAERHSRQFDSYHSERIMEVNGYNNCNNDRRKEKNIYA